MPVMSGIEAISIIKNKYKEVKKELAKRKSAEVIVRPVICFFSQENRTTMNLFLQKKE